MFCENCGKELNENDVICGNCKYPIRNNGEIKEGSDFKLICLDGKYRCNGMPMNWYQFIIWGYLIFMLVFETVFSVMGFLNIFNSFYGIFSLPVIGFLNFVKFVFHAAIAVLVFLSRRYLLKFKYKAIKLLLISVIAFTAGNILFTFINIFINPLTVYAYLMWLVIFVINGCFMIPFNYVYFKKRVELFRN